MSQIGKPDREIQVEPVKLPDRREEPVPETTPAPAPERVPEPEVVPEKVPADAGSAS